MQLRSRCLQFCVKSGNGRSQKPGEGPGYGALSNRVLEMQSKIKGQGKELGISFQGGTEW